MLSPFSMLVPLVALGAMLVSALPLFTIGCWIQDRLFARLDAPPATFALLTIGTSAALGYIVLGGYLIDAGLGRIASASVWVAAAIVLARGGARQRLWLRLTNPDVAIPASAMVAAALFYVTLHFGLLPDPLPDNWSWSGHAQFSRFVATPDHIYPLWFAQQLFDSADLSQHHLSDRPPLQSGMVLVSYPLWRAIESISGQPGVTSSFYQVFAVLLQCSWIAAVYALLRAIRIDGLRLAIVLLTLIPSHFFFVHSVFVWPKLLAGSLAIGSFCLLLFRDANSPNPSTPRVAAAAGMAILAFLAHGGVATALLGFGLVGMAPHYFPGWRNALIGICIVVMLWAPWAAVIRWVAPPGNYIAKVHLAGVNSRDDRTTFEAVRDAHAAMPLPRLLERKWRKVRYVAGLDDPNRSFGDLESAFRSMRRTQFLQVVPSLDVLNLGWLIVPAGCWVGSAASRRRFRVLGRLLAISLLCVGLWIAVLFSPPIIQHASFAAMILLFTSLAAAIAMLPLAVAVPILLTHVAIAPAAILGFSAVRQYAAFNLTIACLVYLAGVASVIAFRSRLADLDDGIEPSS